MTIEETRSACKEKIESLEFWLRRLLDLTLTAKYGASYFDAKDADGTPIFGNKIRSHATARMNADPQRYP